MPTRRLFFLLLLAAPWGAAEPLVLVGVAIGLLALLAAGVDWLLAGDGRRVRAQRVLASDKLSLGAWNLVQIELSNQTARPQRVLLRDLPPLSFALDLPVPVFTVRPPGRRRRSATTCGRRNGATRPSATCTCASRARSG